MHVILRKIILIAIIVVPLILCCVFSGFAVSLAVLGLAARKTPIIGKINLICFWELVCVFSLDRIDFASL